MDFGSKSNIGSRAESLNDEQTRYMVSGASNPDMQQPFTPDEIMFEILSWLPVRSLLRLKCLSKKIYSLIEERHFIRKHISQTPFSKTHAMYNTQPLTLSTSDPSDNVKETFEFICGCDGLIINKSNNTGMYHIQNPTTRKNMILPRPHVASINMSLFSISGEYKLVSIIDEKINKMGNQGCEILNVGVDDTWRYLKLPKSADENKDIKVIAAVSAGEAYHFVMSIKSGSYNNLDEVISLDLNTERYTTTCIPTEVPPVSEMRLWSIDWDGRLAFVEWMEKSLNAWVLEDFKKHKWGVKKRLFGSKLCAKDLNNCVPLFCKGDDLWVWEKEKKLFCWSFESEKIIRSHIAREGYNIKNKIYVYPPSLVNIKGMIHVDS